MAGPNRELPPELQRVLDDEKDSPSLSIFIHAFYCLDSHESIKNGLLSIIGRIRRKGWEMIVSDEISPSNTASFSRKDGKQITLYTGGKSERHVFASLIHEYLYADLTQRASESPDPYRYFRDNYMGVALRDRLFAEFVDLGERNSNTSHYQKKRAERNALEGISDKEISYYLGK